MQCLEIDHQVRGFEFGKSTVKFLYAVMSMLVIIIRLMRMLVTKKREELIAFEMQGYQ